MSDTIKALISELIITARHRGMTQAQLAERAGLSAVGLSKAKHRGDIRASTLEALGKQVDLELALVPRRSRQQAANAIKAGAFFRLSGEADERGD